MPAFAASPSHAAVAAAVLAAALAAWGVFRVRGSTAVPAAVWAVVSCLALAADMAGHAADRLADPAAAAAARLAVVALSLCPTMSLLGAKRPQHGVWQGIVASLAFVLFLPAISARLVRPGSLPDLHMIERVFMPVLIIVGWLNFAATRRGLAVTCAAIGQALLARGFLPGVSTEATAFGGSLDMLAVGLIATATVIATAQSLRAHGGTKHHDGSLPAPKAAGGLAAALDPPFLALRETLGAAWALRLAEAFDAQAVARGWPCRLRFGGLEVDDTNDVAWHRAAGQTFRALARRFVDDDWMTRHGWPGGAVEGDS